jgi:hypothetical protein
MMMFMASTDFSNRRSWRNRYSTLPGVTFNPRAKTTRNMLPTIRSLMRRAGVMGGVSSVGSAVVSRAWQSWKPGRRIRAAGQISSVIGTRSAFPMLDISALLVGLRRRLLPRRELLERLQELATTPDPHDQVGLAHDQSK